MSANSNNQPKNIGVNAAAGMANPNLPPNMNQLQGQSQLGAGFAAGQFQMAQAQALAQAHSKALAAQAVHAQLHAQLQAQGLSFNQPQTGMGSSSAKRIPQKPPIMRPPVPMAGMMNTMVSPLKNAMDLTPASRSKKKQKLPEKQMHDKVAAILPESALYTQLLEFEARVDAALVRKKVDIQEALKTPPSVQKTLRIYVFNTTSSSSNQTKEPPTWTLKIVGRVLEDGVDPEQAVNIKPNPMYPKFSSFFKRVTISLDQRLYPDNYLIIWDSSRASAHHEGFEVKRKGETEFTATIRLEMNYMPDKYKLSPALTEVLGVEVDTRPRIIASIWHYVKARKLQLQSDPSFFTCDPPLQRVFGEEKVKFTMVSQRISEHLTPPQPIILEHQIKLTGSNPYSNLCYDVLVDIPFPIQRELNMLLANTEKHKEVESCDEAICAAIRKIHEHRRRRAFFLGFSQSPVEFINALVESQSRDLKLVSGEAGRSGEKERKSDFFNQPWVEDAVIRYLTRKPATGNDGS